MIFGQNPKIGGIPKIGVPKWGSGETFSPKMVKNRVFN